MSDTSNRNEQATQKHRQEARSRGQVARSAEVSSTAAIVAGVIGLAWVGPALGQAMVGYMHDTLSILHHSTRDMPFAETLSFQSMMSVLLNTVLWIGILYLGALVAGFGQVGFDFAEEALEPKWENLSWASGAKRLLSWTSVVKTLAAVLKLMVIILACKGVVHDAMNSDVLNRQVNSMELVTYMMQMALSLGWRVAAATGVIAAADYGFQRWNNEQQLKMSKDEIKEESKQTEGNPQMRGRIRGLMRQRHRQRMMKEVAQATVIVTNPTHVAIALRYDRMKMKAPRVVGKGLEHMALRIREIAKANNIPIIENKPLARGLYRHCPLGKEIPASYFQAVAMVLAQVYRLASQRGASSAPSPAAATPQAVPPIIPQRPQRRI